MFPEGLQNVAFEIAFVLFEPLPIVVLAQLGEELKCLRLKAGKFLQLSLPHPSSCQEPNILAQPRERVPAPVPDRKSTRRPAQSSSPEHVNVQMGDFLAPVGARIHHQTIPVNS